MNLCAYRMLGRLQAAGLHEPVQTPYPHLTNVHACVDDLICFHPLTTCFHYRKADKEGTGELSLETFRQVMRESALLRDREIDQVNNNHPIMNHYVT